MTAASRRPRRPSRAGQSDFESVRQVFRGEEYALVIREVADRVRSRYEEIVASGKRPVVVDAGANIGTASLWFSRQYPQAAIVAIEPDPHNAEILNRNTQGRHITVIEAAIGGQNGFVSVLNNGQVANAASMLSATHIARQESDGG